jgi:hypothetical protein
MSGKRAFGSRDRPRWSARSSASGGSSPGRGGVLRSSGAGEHAEQRVEQGDTEAVLIAGVAGPAGHRLGGDVAFGARGVAGLGDALA